jgi:cysteine desulfurase / selenocysteine lyase
MTTPVTIGSSAGPGASPGGDLAARIRPDFPLLHAEVDGNPVVYLDSAATSLTPTPVLDAMNRFYNEVGGNVHRGKHHLSETASNDVEQARINVAEFTGFRSNEVVFTANATASLNLVARGIPLTGDDLVLVPLDGHHSAILPWRERVRVEYIPLDEHAEVDLDRYAGLLDLRPRVVVLNHCSNVTGGYAPVAEMARMAKDVGAVTVLDAAQSIPHRRVAIPHVDFLAFSAHKMLGPTGIGVLCGRYEELARLTVPALGGGTVDWVDTERFDLRKLPHRLEAGTPNIAGIYGLDAALGYLSGLGWDAVAAHDRELGTALINEVARRPYLRPVGARPGADRGAIMSFSVASNPRLKAAAKILSDSYGIMCRTGHMCAQPLVDRFTDDEVLRVSAYVYNTAAEITEVLDAVDDIVGVLGTAR